MLKKLVEIDQSWSELFRIKNGSLLLKTSRFLAHSGDSWIWFPALAFISTLKSIFWKNLALQLLIGATISALLVTALKYTFCRTRPAGTWGKMYRFYDPHSFPSGHATRVFVLTFLSFHLLSFWIACLILLWATLVSLARVANGVHYFSDILTGGLIGIMVGYLVLLLHLFG